ncbi:DMT family transporter [Demequina salsinemoris]|uniref:DMT family transporter n=1 Tax=Demequina salsinemoris TaxID=577470 RepID=UPI00078388D8|nr:DMT family transporter [Demequina salsinemoris]
MTTSAPAAPASSGRGRSVAIVSLLGATLFWAGNYIVGAEVVHDVDPLSLVLLRWSIAVVPLLVLAQVTERPDWRAAARAWPWLIALCATGLAGYNLLLYSSLQFIGAFDAGLINAFNPALIVLAAALVLRQPLTRRSVGGVAIALVGVLVVLTNGEPWLVLTNGFGTGQLLMIGAITAWTAYTILGRLAPQMPPITSTSLQAVIGVAVLAPIALLSGGPALPSTGTGWWALLFIAIFPSVLSYPLWNRALTALPAGSAGVFLNLITVFTTAFTIAAGHPWTYAELLGGVAVIGGVTLANLRPRGRSTSSRH